MLEELGRQCWTWRGGGEPAGRLQNSVCMVTYPCSAPSCLGLIVWAEGWVNTCNHRSMPYRGLLSGDHQRSKAGWERNISCIQAAGSCALRTFKGGILSCLPTSRERAP